MRILYHHRTQAEDGQAVHIRALQTALVQAGAQVDEFSLVARSGAAPASTRAPRSQRWSLVARLPRFARELAEYAYTSYARGKLVQAARRHKSQIIYERYAFGNAAGVQAARKLKLPLILEVNSPMVLELSRTRGLSFPRWGERMEKYVFQSADRVIVVSAVLGDMLVDMGVKRERLCVMPNGVHMEDYPPAQAGLSLRARQELGLDPTAFVLGFVGYYRDWHRLDLVLEALRAPGLERGVLVLIGEGPAREALQARASQLGLEQRLRLAGPRGHREIPALLPAFDVALVPAINAYASPLKLTEYMAASLCVIAPDQPNLREVLRHEGNALLFEPADGTALARAILRLATDAALRARLGQAARQTVIDMDLTWSGNARRVLQLAQDLVP